MKRLTSGILIAALFWFFMFSPWTKHLVNFWVMMIFATGFLTLFSLLFGYEDLKKLYKFEPRWLIIGIIGAISLYIIFYAGNYFSKLLFNFTQSQVGNIYSIKEQGSKIFIGFALLLWIGPAEEIFWRGYVQHNISKTTGDVKAFIITTLIYALVHIWSFNFMLVMAALICGIFWGWLFMKYKNVIPCIISHALWDVAIFIIFPIT